jgi:hypothetical protein
MRESEYIHQCMGGSPGESTWAASSFQPGSVVALQETKIPILDYEERCCSSPLINELLSQRGAMVLVSPRNGLSSPSRDLQVQTAPEALRGGCRASHKQEVMRHKV